MTDNYNVLLIDVYNLFYKMSFVEEEQITTYKDSKIHIEGIVGFIKILEKYLYKYGIGDDTIVYFLFDNAKSSISKYRKYLSEDYKKTRLPQPDYFYQALNNLELLLKYYRNNSFIFRIAHIEADDYCKNILEYYINKDDKVLQISEDMDWMRSLSTNVHQLAKGQIYTKEVFQDEYGFEPTYSNICFWKSFYGDKSDNIQALLKELPKVYFYEILNKSLDMNDFIQKVKSNILNYGLGWKEKIAKEEQNLLLNWNLVSSIEISNKELDTFKYTCKYDPLKLKLIYTGLGIVGKIDSRIKEDTSQEDPIFSIMNGISINRKS